MESSEPLADLRGNKSAPVVAFVSHCKDFAGRMLYINLLQKSIGVDVYGDCGTLQCGNPRNMGHQYRVAGDPCFHLVNTKYRFYLAFENALCKDYVTEKIFNALRLNTIPVVFGGGNYSALLPPNSFVDARQFSSPRELAGHLGKILASPTLWNSYFDWRPHYDITSFASVPDNCALCDQLVSGELGLPNIYEDIFTWLVRRAGCIYTKPSWGPEEFRKIWKR